MERIFNIIPGPQEDTCCILLYGEIGDYGDVGAEDVVRQIAAAERTYRKIDVRINSVGGDVAAGIAIFNFLRQSAADITIYIDCIAASTASFIAGCGKRVKMSRYGQIMIHQPMSDVFGNAAKLKDCVVHLEQIENTLCEIYAERTGKSVEEIRTTYMDGRDHWLTAEEALAEGFVDEIFDDDRTAVSASLTPRERCERYTALYIEHVSLKNQEQMINKLRSMPAFSDCADEAAVMSRITEVVNKAQEHAAVVAERDALKEKVADLERKEREAAEAAYDAEVDTAREEERIGADEVPGFKAKTPRTRARCLRHASPSAASCRPSPRRPAPKARPTRTTSPSVKRRFVPVSNSNQSSIHSIMANPNIQTAYGGEVLDQILVMAATGNQLFEKGLIHMETSIGDKFYIPRLQLSKLLQKRVEMPKSENSKGEFKIDERLLKPEDIMVYTEFNPRSFEKFWKKWQPTGNLVFRQLPSDVQVTLLSEVLKQVGTELGYHFIQGVSGDGEEQFFNGILTRMLADPDVVKATCAETSQIKRLRAVWEKTADKVRDQANFTFLMSSADFDKYDNELTDLHHKGADPTSTNIARFKGKRIAALNDWPDGVIVGTICSLGTDSNLYAGCNLADDYECLQVDKVQASGELYFIKMLMKADTQIAWGQLVTLLDCRAGEEPSDDQKGDQNGDEEVVG